MTDELSQTEASTTVDQNEGDGLATKFLESVVLQGAGDVLVQEFFSGTVNPETQDNQSTQAIHGNGDIVVDESKKEPDTNERQLTNLKIGPERACPTCKGRRTIKCNSCRGTGKVSGALCNICIGAKTITCPTCDGSGVA